MGVKDGAQQEESPSPGWQDMESPTKESDPVSGALLLAQANWVYVHGVGVEVGVGAGGSALKHDTLTKTTLSSLSILGRELIA